jgi:hypothetical protein
MNGEIPRVDNTVNMRYKNILRGVLFDFKYVTGRKINKSFDKMTLDMV